MSSLIYVTII
jgi:hypothetical protein